MKHFLLLLFFGYFSMGVRAGLVILDPEVLDIDPPSDGTPTEVPEPEGHHTPQVPETDELTFFNGNTLGGDLMSIDEKGVVWNHSDVIEPIRFAPKNLKQISLVVESEKEKELSTLPRIELTNGDAIRGELVRLGPEVLEIRSPAVGEVSVQRNMIRRIDHKLGDGLLYLGPKEGDWALKNHRGGDKTGWRLIDGALIAESGNVSASMEPADLPDQITFHLDVEWRGNFNMNVGFWGMDSDNPTYNTYSLSLQEHYVRIHRNFQKNGHSNITQQQLQPPLTKGRATISLHLDATRKNMVLFIDERMVGQWRDAADFPLRGNMFSLYNQSNSPIRISNIRIETWDGKLQASSSEREDSLDEILTVSGDRLTGTVNRIEKGALIFQSEFAELKVPLDRLQTMHFAKDAQQEPDLIESALQVHSVNDDRITLDLLKMKEGVLTGRSTAAGEITFQAEYLKNLTLNPADDRHEEQEWAWD